MNASKFLTSILFSLIPCSVAVQPVVFAHPGTNDLVVVTVAVLNDALNEFPDLAPATLLWLPVEFVILKKTLPNPEVVSKAVELINIVPE